MKIRYVTWLIRGDRQDIEVRAGTVCFGITVHTSAHEIEHAPWVLGLRHEHAQFQLWKTVAEKDWDLFIEALRQRLIPPRVAARFIADV